MSELVEVVGGLIIFNNRVLLTQRTADQDFAFCWECPGGKQEGTEEPHDTLKRELEEEIGIKTIAYGLKPLFRAEFRSIVKRDGRAHVAWSLHRILSWDGQPSTREGQGLGWFNADELRRLAFTPGNRAALPFILAELGTSEIPNMASAFSSES